MPGFSGLTMHAENNSGGNSTSSAGTGAISASELLAGRQILMRVCTRIASGTAPTVDGSGMTMSGGGGAFTYTTPTLLHRYTSTNSHNVELWTCTITGNATSSASGAGTLTGTASRREASIQVFSGWPSAWSLQASATFVRASNGTSQPCGTVTGVADDALLTTTMLNGSSGPTTAASDYTLYDMGGSSTAQRRVLTSGFTGDGAWTSTNSREVGAASHLVLREPGLVSGKPWYVYRQFRVR